jgi:hypothetical protein
MTKEIQMPKREVTAALATCIPVGACSILYPASFLFRILNAEKREREFQRFQSSDPRLIQSHEFEH